ncbi:MAG TPA: NDP-sugar synthase [Nitrospirales bacterium]|jgi:NDP-sugar pyrophosphorylase family protein
MKAMILAAGYGTRLRPLTLSLPKPLLLVGGRPLLVWNLLLLKQHGITEALINLHYRGDQIVEALGDGSRYGMRLAYSHEPVILGTGGGIEQAQSYFGNLPFLVLNGDTISDCDLTALIETHRAAQARATLAVREDSRAVDWGAVMVDADSRILQIKGEPALAQQPATDRIAVPASYMFAGAHVLEPDVVKAIPPGPGSIIDVYIELLRQGQPLTAYRMSGYWSDIGTPERYAAAQQDVSKGLLALARKNPPAAAAV